MEKYYVQFIESIQDEIKEIKVDNHIEFKRRNHHIKNTFDIDIDVLETITLNNGKIAKVNYSTYLKEIKDSDIKDGFIYTGDKCLNEYIDLLVIRIIYDR